MLQVPPTSVSSDDRTSRSWDPALTKRLDEALGEVIRFVEGRDASFVLLSPAVLCSISEECGALYGAAFKRVYRPKWAETTFPKGFDSLVLALNERLTSAGSSTVVTNAKRDVPLYVSHNEEQLNLIGTIKQSIREGMPAADALAILKELGIPLSEGQRRDLLREPRVPREDRTLDDLRRLCRELKAGTDLSDRQLVKGELFEQFVGVVLASIHGAGAVKGQKGLPIVYRDLDGHLHSSVYLDYVLNGQDVIEVKWRNNWKNIITSVLPQMMALRRSAEFPPEAGRAITVVYRETQPELAAGVFANVSLREDALEMQLGAGLDPNDVLLLGEIVRYESIEALMSRSPIEVDLAAVLRALDRAVEHQPAEDLRAYAGALKRIRYSDDDTAFKLNYLSELMTTGLTVNSSDLASFGIPPAPDDPAGAARRAHLFERSRRSGEERILLEVYQDLTGLPERILTAEAVIHLAKLLPDELEARIHSILDRREQELKARMQQRLSVEEDPVQTMKAVYRKMFRRGFSERADRMATVMDLAAEDAQQFKLRCKIWADKAPSFSASGYQIMKGLSAAFTAAGRPADVSKIIKVINTQLKATQPHKERLLAAVMDVGTKLRAGFANDADFFSGQQVRLLEPLRDELTAALGCYRRSISTCLGSDRDISKVKKLLERRDTSLRPSARSASEAVIEKLQEERAQLGVEILLSSLSTAVELAQESAFLSSGRALLLFDQTILSMLMPEALRRHNELVFQLPAHTILATHEGFLRTAGVLRLAPQLAGRALEIFELASPLDEGRAILTEQFRPIFKTLRAGLPVTQHSGEGSADPRISEIQRILQGVIDRFTKEPSPEVLKSGLDFLFSWYLSRTTDVLHFINVERGSVPCEALTDDWFERCSRTVCDSMISSGHLTAWALLDLYAKRLFYLGILYPQSRVEAQKLQTVGALDSEVDLLNWDSATSAIRAASSELDQKFLEALVATKRSRVDDGTHQSVLSAQLVSGL